MSDHQDEFEQFCKRKFSGRDLITIMEAEGIGVGATMHIVKHLDIMIERHPTTYRQWDFPPKKKFEMPPLGMVPYLPSHNHDSADICDRLCPVGQWREHVAKHGNPYPKIP